MSEQHRLAVRAASRPRRHVAGARPSSAGLRPEIQGLRALAVGVVVVYHLWPHRLTGGYVGVDVFFVISGFLITSHLAREVAATGSVRVVRFWARRVRRLLPASLLVLLATAVATVLLVPQTYWRQFMREIGAAALYVQNWALAADSIDYLAAENVASPVQHFWSLSVEEQFYLLWPLMIVAAVGLAAVRGRLGASARMRILLSAILLGSFVGGVVQTGTDPSIAYFSTFVRAWEFAAGGLLGLFAAPAWRGLGVRSLVSWIGLLLIGWSAVVYTSATPFPGVAAAVPVVGTLLVIAAGDDAGRTGTRLLYQWRWVQWLGDVSYSVYLWHWPLIVLVPIVLGRELAWPAKVVLLVGTLALAGVTKRQIEDRFRGGALVGRRVLATTYAAALIGMAAVVGTAAAGWWSVERQAAQISEDVELPQQQGVCFGAEAMDPDLDCATDPEAALVPPPAVAEQDTSDVYSNECRTSQSSSEILPCEFGDPDGDFSVALVGDSHAAQWFPAVRALAEENGWRLTVYFKSACPFNAATQEWSGSRSRDTCAEWNTDLDRLLTQTASHDLVLTSATSTHEYAAGATSSQVGIAGFERAWSRLAESGIAVVAIVDNPHLTRDQLDCVAESVPDVDGCGAARTEALDREDLLTPAARAVEGATAVDLNSLLCHETWCPAVIGSVVVYRDTSSHLTQTYVRTLAPYLERELPAEILAALER